MNANVAAFRTTIEDIQALRYLKDPRKAAVYLGISVTQVEDVWAEIIDSPIRKVSKPGRFESTGTMTHLIFRQDSQLASEKLLDAYSRFYAKWERENGFRAGAGKLLLHAGWQESERVAA